MRAVYVCMCVCVVVYQCVCAIYYTAQMSATFDKKKSFFQNCRFFSRNFFPLAHSVVHFAGFAEKSVQFQPHYWHKKIIFSKIKISVCTKCEISNIFDTQKVFLKFFPRTFPLAHSMAHYACFAKQSVQFQPHYWHKKIIFSTMKIVCANCELWPHILDTKNWFKKNWELKIRKFFPRSLSGTLCICCQKG